MYSHYFFDQSSSTKASYSLSKINKINPKWLLRKPASRKALCVAPYVLELSAHISYTPLYCKAARPFWRKFKTFKCALWSRKYGTFAFFYFNVCKTALHFKLVFKFVFVWMMAKISDVTINWVCLQLHSQHCMLIKEGIDDSPPAPGSSHVADGIEEAVE